MNNIKTIIIAGISATTAMTLLMITSPMMGMPKMLIGNMLANFMGTAIFIGWIAHFIIGTLIATNYVILFSKRFNITFILRGMLFSMIPFFVAQIVVMPIIGAGFFFANTAKPMMMVMGSFVGHLVYGAILGIIVGKIENNN